MSAKLCVLMSLHKGDDLEHLITAVESILNQSYYIFDYYIQMDGPIKDECTDYLETLKDDRVKIFKRNVNKGLACSLNDLLKIVLANGYEYIARMDADDISFENRFEVQKEYLVCNHNVDLVGAQTTLIDSKGKEIGRKRLPLEISFKSLLKSCEIVHPSVMFRTDFFSKYGLYDEEMKKSQDYELWLRASSKGAILRNLPETLYKLRYEESLITRRKNEQKYNLALKRRYTSSYFQYCKYTWRHWVILLLPYRLIKLVFRINGINFS
jgi:hypothetical protein